MRYAKASSRVAPCSRKPRHGEPLCGGAGTAVASRFLIRGALSGALLGAATSLALGATVQTGQSIVGALVFPAGFVIILLLGFELLTGSFALLPLAWLERKISASEMLANWGWVLIGNLLGALTYATLLAIVLSMMGTALSAGPSGGQTRRRRDRQNARL